MRTGKKPLKSLFVYIPFTGTIIFFVLYILATFLYPGGSQADENAKGFSWLNNYWCNLLNDTAINGQPNPAQPVAIAGMFILCFALICFWVLFGLLAGISKTLALLIQVPGTLAMVAGFFLYTGVNHDLITNVASVLGLIATTGVYVGLYKLKWKALLGFGLLNILLVIANNVAYYSKELIVYLPVIQKITFAAFLTWVCCINYRLYLLQKAAVSTEPAL